MKKRAFAAILALATTAALPGCGAREDPTLTAETTPGPMVSSPSPTSGSAPALPSAPPAALPDRLDCLREAGATLAVAHRGGPTRDYPENALESLERSRRAGARVMEVDIVRSRDGVLFLMHDDTLDRTSTGEGPVGDHDWAHISSLRLETWSRVTDFAPTPLAAALEWAVANNVLMKLDKKRATPYAPIIAAIRAAGAENHVIVLTYTDDQAVDIHTNNPDLVISATIRNPADLDRLVAKGVDPGRLVAWTGTTQPNPALWDALRNRGVESAFGTLGFDNQKLDTLYWADGDGSEYNALSAQGLVFIDTDRSDMVTRQLDAGDAAAACGF